MVSLIPPDLAVDHDVERQQARRRDRWRLRSIIARAGDRAAHLAGSWESVVFARTAACGRMVVDDVVSVMVRDASAYVAGVATCSSVWACPVCEAKIRTGRAVELRDLAGAHAAAGGSVGLLTLTVRHDRGHRLADLMDAEAEAWRSIQQDLRWRALRDETAQVAGVDLVGFVRSWEVTQGFTSSMHSSGWHPHFHIALLWADDGPHHDDVAWIADAWAERIERRLGVRPNDHGHDYRTIPTSDVEYISKISDEVTRADLKSGSRSVWALVEAAGDGEAWAARRWNEYVTATKGRRAVQYTRGLRDRYALGDEATDEELATTDQGGDVVMRISKGQWRWYLTAGYGQVPRAVDLLQMVEHNAHNVGSVDGGNDPPVGAAASP